MLNDPQSGDLATALRTTVQQAAMLFARTAEGGPWVDDLVIASLTFSGDGETGTVQLATTTRGAALLTAGMLGLDDTADEAAVQSEDALAETLHIACGLLCAQWFDPDTVWTLEMPTVMTTPADTIDSYWPTPTCSTSLLIDETHRLDIALVM